MCYPVKGPEKSFCKEICLHHLKKSFTMGFDNKTLLHVITDIPKKKSFLNKSLSYNCSIYSYFFSNFLNFSYSV